MTSKPTLPKAPRHLRPATRRWFDRTVAEWELRPDQVMTLEAAASAWDRLSAARETLNKLGTTFTDPAGCPRARPEVIIERDSRIAWMRAIRELNFAVSAPDSRPPEIR